MIISNHYKKNQVVLHNAIHKKPLPPIVCTTRQLRYGICWRIRITHCEAIKILATNSVCQTNKLHKAVTINVKISLTVTVVKAETESDNLSDIFFQPIKSMMNAKEQLEWKNWVYCLCKHGIVVHKCLFAKELSLPWNPLGGSKAA